MKWVDWCNNARLHCRLAYLTSSNTSKPTMLNTNHADRR